MATVATVVVAIIIWALWPSNKSPDIDSPDNSAKTVKNRQVQKPLCLLSGEMVDTKKSKEQGFGALGNIVRLRFDATVLKQCEDAALDYCHTTVDQGFLPGALNLKFRENNEPESPNYEYTVDRNCLLHEK